MARLLTTPYDLPELVFTHPWDPKTDPHEIAFQALLDASDSLPEGEVKGALLKWQRGDGYAWYLVTNDRPLTLQWVPFLDAWSVEPALIRGLNLADVQGMVQGARAFRALFSKKQEA